MLRVLIIDDHPIYATGLEASLRLEPDIEVVGLATDGAAGVELCRQLNPDVVILDVRLPGESGPEVARRLRQTCPDCQIVALTGYDDEQMVSAMIRAGAMGYLLKEVTPVEIAEAIRAVAAGTSQLTPSVARQVLEQFAALTGQRTEDPTDELTARERQVLQAISRGKSNREIAQDLAISERTVQNHLHNIYQKLELRDRSQAILYAIKHSIASPPFDSPSSNGVH